MQTFPPQVSAYTAEADEYPDTRSPSRFLLWTVKRQRGAFALFAVISALAFVSETVLPWALGRAVDEGIASGRFDVVVAWAAVVLLVVMVGVGLNVANHSLIVVNWLMGMYGVIERLNRKAKQLGHVLPRRVALGEVLSIGGSDSSTIGRMLMSLSLGVGAVFALVAIGVFMFLSSPKLGLVLVIGGPLLVAVALPVLKPLHAARARERGRTSRLTGQATDIVAGLRILRGIGGERTFSRNYRLQSQRARAAGVVTGSWQAALEALSVLLGGVLLVALTYLGTQEMLSGKLTIGQLISFFGYAMLAIWPLQVIFEAIQDWVQALVAARKTIAVFGSASPWPTEATNELPSQGDIRDLSSGFAANQAQLTLVVSPDPEVSAALADRLGRYLPPVVTEEQFASPEELKGREARKALAAAQKGMVTQVARDTALAKQDWGVEVAGVDLASVPLVQVRQNIFVSDAQAALFAGTLQEAIDPHGTASRVDAEAALRAAAAEDVYDGLPGGWQGQIEERGRGLSGGQRQRVVLARALLRDAEILVLVEPTSAVDAHTEARIAERVAEYRAGKTTIVCSASPLWLHHADSVVFLSDEGAMAGSHSELLDSCDAYRAVVLRGEDEL